MNISEDVQISNTTAMAGLGDLDALVLEYADNKARADELTARNAEIAEALEKAARFRDGSNTGHLTAGGGQKVTVTRRFNTRWVAEKLEAARAKMTDELFFKVFAWRYEPRSKKDLDGFLEYASPEFRAAILEAMEISPGKPAIKLEALQ